MVCTDLVRDDSLRGGVRPSRYSVPHEDGRRLNEGWFRRAPDRHNCEPEEGSERFVFACIAPDGQPLLRAGRNGQREAH